MIPSMRTPRVEVVGGRWGSRRYPCCRGSGELPVATRMVKMPHQVEHDWVGCYLYLATRASCTRGCRQRESNCCGRGRHLRRAPRKSACLRILRSSPTHPRYRPAAAADVATSTQSYGSERRQRQRFSATGDGTPKSATPDHLPESRRTQLD